MANSRQVATGLSSFIQAFSAVDAVGSRRRRERKLDERLEDEREFRAQQLAFQQSSEDRAQEAHDETREAKENRREGDRIALDPKSTDAQLNEWAPWSEMAARKLQYRQQTGELTGVFSSLADQALDARQTNAAQAGAVGEETEQLSGLSQGVEAARFPGDIAETRKFSSKEIAKQRGASGTELLGEAGFSADVPGDYLTLDEIKELGKSDPDQAEAIRRRQTAELIEADPRDGTAQAAAQKGRDLDKATQGIWATAADASDPLGDSHRKFIKENPSAATSAYFDARNGLSTKDRRETDRMMKPVTEKALAEQRLILDAPDADPTGQDVKRARRKYSRALAVDQMIVTDFDPAKETGIDARGIPNKESGEALAGAYGETMRAGPRTDGSMIADNKQRQVMSQLVRDHANPTKKASPQQLKNLAIGVQMGVIPPQDAVWAAWHGGQLPGPLPEHIVVGKDATLIAKDSGGNFRIIHSPTKSRVENEFSAGSRQALKEHFSAFNTNDDKGRGSRYQSEFMNFVGRTRQLANEAGIDLSSEIDLVQLAGRWQQMGIFQKEFHEQAWEFGKLDVVGNRSDYAEHFDEFDASVYGVKVDEFLASKRKEGGGLLDEFRDIQLDPLRGSGVDAIGFRRAVHADSPEAGAELDRRFPSDQALQEAILFQAQRE